MDFYDLELDEAIIIQSSNVSRDGYDESEFEDEYLQEILLTNKNIVYVVAEEDGTESEDCDIITVPLSSVKVINGQVQVKQVQHDLYGLCLQVQFLHGVEYWRFSVKAKQQIPRWVTEMSKAVLAVPADFGRNEAKEAATSSTANKPKEEEYMAPTVAVSNNSTTCFCVNCGAKMLRTAKFCSECGIKIDQNATPYSEQDAVVYDGKLHKCRNCGEILKAFETTCPICGYELRDTYASAAIRSFAEKIEQMQQNGKSKDKNNIINLIRTYPIPNTKEDLFEFIILTGANIRENRYDDDMPKYKQEISDAWKAKFEQAYRKAKIAFEGDKSFKEIEVLYREKMGEQKQAKRKKRLLEALPFIGCALIGVIGWSSIFLVDHIKIKKETERLDSIVEEVYDYIEREQYTLARSKVSTLVFSGSITTNGDREAAKWDITRQQFFDVIDKAEYGEELISIKREIRLGLSQDDIKGKDYQEIKKQLKNKGFTNIKTETYKDITTGWWTSEGIIEKVSIDGETVFKEDSTYYSDVEIIIYYHASDVQNSENIDKTDSSQSKEDNSSQEENVEQSEENSLDVTISKGSIYTYGHDDWELYVMTAISDTMVKIEKWEKTLSTQKAFSYSYDVGAFKITDAEYGFSWLDEGQTAITFVLTDSQNGDFKKSREVVFTISGTDRDTNKGTNYSENNISYKYQCDDWNFYRAIPISDGLLKIECWVRPLAIGGYHYGYDVMVIEFEGNDDIEWTDESKTSFTISLQDTQNSNLKKSKLTLFEIE